MTGHLATLGLKYVPCVHSCQRWRWLIRPSAGGDAIALPATVDPANVGTAEREARYIELAVATWRPVNSPGSPNALAP